MVGTRAGRAENGGPVFKEHRASVWEDGEVLEVWGWLPNSMSAQGAHLF